jgi:hypothetical protein
MKTTYFFTTLALGATLAFAADKPTAYDHITKDGAAIDAQVNAALSLNYTIVPVEDSPDYVASKATAGSLPTSAKTSSGEALTGYVLLAYVVNTKGHAVNPMVLKTTDPRLNSFAIKASSNWRFEPAKLKGVPIATTAAQEFNFKDETPKGFVTDDIMLYQPNEVLAQRLPGADQFAAYIKQLQAALTDYYAGDKTAEKLQTVIALRSGNRSRVWFVSSLHSGKNPIFDTLRQTLEAIKPVDVKGGTIAFVISGSIAGGDGKNTHSDKDDQPPIPREWQEAAKDLKRPILVPDGFLDAVWPDKK